MKIVYRKYKGIKNVILKSKGEIIVFLLKGCGICTQLSLPKRENDWQNVAIKRSMHVHKGENDYGGIHQSDYNSDLNALSFKATLEWLGFKYQRSFSTSRKITGVVRLPWVGFEF